jgi:hypothetical protein
MLFHLFENFILSDGLAAACRFISAYTASAFHGFSAIWAYAVAIVDKISAVHATRLIFFRHCFASAIFMLHTLRD